MQLHTCDMAVSLGLGLLSEPTRDTQEHPGTPHSGNHAAGTTLRFSRARQHTCGAASGQGPLPSSGTSGSTRPFLSPSLAATACQGISGGRLHPFQWQISHWATLSAPALMPAISPAPKSDDSAVQYLQGAVHGAACPELGPSRMSGAWMLHDTHHRTMRMKLPPQSTLELLL